MLKTAYVAYYIYFLAAMSAVSAYMMHSDFIFTLVNVCIIALLYQTATSLLKQKQWAWWSSVLILALSCLTSFASIFLDFTASSAGANIGTIIFNHRFTLVILTASALSLFQLFKPITRHAYKPNN